MREPAGSTARNRPSARSASAAPRRCRVRARERDDPAQIAVGLEHRRGLRDRPTSGAGVPVRASVASTTACGERRAMTATSARNPRRDPPAAPAAAPHVERVAAGDRWQASLKPRSTHLAECRAGHTVDGLEAQWRRHDTRRTPASVRSRRARPAGTRLVRPRAEHEADRQALDSAREIGQPARRRAIAPVQVVDDEQHGALGGDVRGQPVQAVQDRRLLGRRRGRRRTRIGDAGGVGRRSRQPALTIGANGSCDRRSKSWRTTAYGNESSSWPPRALMTSMSRSMRDLLASCNSVLFPIPGGPSTRATAPRPPRRHAASRRWPRAHRRARAGPPPPTGRD